MDDKGLWQAVLGELELSTNMTKAGFSTWFDGTSIASNESGRVIIGTPSMFHKEQLAKRYHVQIKQTLMKLNSSVTSVEYTIGKAAAAPAVKLSSSGKPGATFDDDDGDLNEAPSPRQEAPKAAATSGYNNRYSFDNFVVGSSNELAYAASVAVVKFPGTKYNPLFIYGGVGLGKTHLMQAVGNEIVRKDPGKKICYVTSEEFTNEFLRSLSQKKTQYFADKYRKVDVLIVDDIQFLGSKERTQEEFFHTFNALHQANKQIILSSDKQPQAIPGLEDRLKSRFASGMMADISAPDLETRSAILQRKAAAQGVLLSVEVIDYIAKNVASNVRELEGSLTRFIAHCEFHHVEASVAAAASLFGSRANGKTKARAVTPKAILDKVANYYDLSSADLIGPKRDKEIVTPRQVAMYLMRHELSLSFPKIAAVVGGRDHSTAMHSVTKIEKLLEVDEALRGELSAIKERITA